MLKRFIAVFITVSILFSIPLLTVKAKGANLISANDSQMNDISSWRAFEGGYVQMGSANGENVLFASGLGTRTWYTPAYNIYNVIRSDVLKNGGGRYQISFSIALIVTGDGEQEISSMIRSTNKTPIMDIANNEKDEFRKKLSIVFGKNGEWKDYSITIGVKPEDVKNEGEEWLFCFDKIPEALTGMYIDDFSVCRYSDDSEQTVLMHSCKPSKKTFSGVASNATPTAKTNATPVPRVTPSASGNTAVNSGTVETGKNLFDEKTSTLENVNAVGQTAWTTFSSIGLSISDGGYSGKCLKATGHSVTWASPAINIFPYIKEAGTYTFSAMVKVTGSKEETDYSFIIRGTKEKSFIPQRGSNFFGSVGRGKLTSGEWSRIVGQFTVSEEDMEEQDTWTLCISSIPLEVGEVFIDEAVLIKGTEKQLPEMKEPDEGVSVKEGSVSKYTVGQLYKPELKEAIITTSIYTSLVVVLVIAGRIFLLMLIKKGRKK